MDQSDLKQLAVRREEILANTKLRSYAVFWLERQEDAQLKGAPAEPNGDEGDGLDF